MPSLPANVSSKTNLHHSLATDTNRVVVLNNATHIVTLSLDENSNDTTILTKFDVTSVLSTQGHCGSPCNGLVAVYTTGSNKTTTVLLLNPCTLDYFVVPRAEFIGDSKSNSYFARRVGLGYDSHTNDYKLVLFGITYSTMIPEFHMRSMKQTMVYSLNDNSWSSPVVEDDEFIYWDIYSYECALINDDDHIHILHWMREHYIQHEESSIARFDVHFEKWIDDLLLPYDCSIDGFESEIGVLDGCLSISSGMSSITMWVMKEYGVEESWTKLFCFDGQTNDHFGFVTALAYSREKHDIVLMLTKKPADNYRLRWYDTIYHSFIDDVVVDDEIKSCYAYVSVESLVAVSRGH